MSNGGFGGIHQRLLDILSSRRGGEVVGMVACHSERSEESQRA
jgi:hypothetical protein